MAKVLSKNSPVDQTATAVVLFNAGQVVVAKEDSEGELLQGRRDASDDLGRAKFEQPLSSANEAAVVADRQVLAVSRSFGQGVQVWSRTVLEEGIGRIGAKAMTPERVDMLAFRINLCGAPWFAITGVIKGAIVVSLEQRGKKCL